MKVGTWMKIRSFKNIILWIDMSNEWISWMKQWKEKIKIKIKILSILFNEEMYSKCINFNLTYNLTKNIYLVLY